MKIVGIYKITSPTGKVYIGQSWDVLSRLRGYKYLKCTKQTILYRSLLKHTVASHRFEIAHELPTDVEQSIMDRFEQLYMDLYRDAGVTLMNVREGGSNGKLHPDSVEKMRKAITGRKLSPEHIEKGRLRMLGKKIGLGNKHTTEWKIKNGLRQRGIPKPHGAKHSVDANAHKSKLMKGNKYALGNVQTIQEKWKRGLAIRLAKIKKLRRAG